ncbi:hypothetical protein AB0D34_02590 [Streptomyces sp. NPDC048420]|uniref:hypothetical protein n=1 Tax=Streptomyces sp. NPDC048420 TaxID=3155755 RepID=UPI0034375CC3
MGSSPVLLTGPPGSVAQGRRDTQPGRLVNSRLRGIGPSLTTVDLPFSSWPVTTLRTPVRGGRRRRR